MAPPGPGGLGPAVTAPDVFLRRFFGKARMHTAGPVRFRREDPLPLAEQRRIWREVSVFVHRADYRGRNLRTWCSAGASGELRQELVDRRIERGW